MRKFRGEVGFTMVEMITTMTILAILSVFSVKPMGRYIAKARQAEAKTTLGHVSTLQAAHAIDKQTYANAGNSSGNYGNTGATKCSVTPGSGQNCSQAGGTQIPAGNVCTPGALDLRLQGCKSLRYQYTILGDTNGFYGMAQVEGDKIIFGCKPKGAPVPTAIPTYNPANAGEGTRYGSGTVSIPATQEDVHFVTEEAGLTTAFDVTTNCE